MIYLPVRRILSPEPRKSVARALCRKPETFRVLCSLLLCLRNTRRYWHKIYAHLGLRASRGSGMESAFCFPSSRFTWLTMEGHLVPDSTTRNFHQRLATIAYSSSHRLHDAVDFFLLVNGIPISIQSEDIRPWIYAV